MRYFVLAFLLTIALGSLFGCATNHERMFAREFGAGKKLPYWECTNEYPVFPKTRCNG